MRRIASIIFFASCLFAMADTEGVWMSNTWPLVDCTNIVIYDPNIANDISSNVQFRLDVVGNPNGYTAPMYGSPADGVARVRLSKYSLEESTRNLEKVFTNFSLPYYTIPYENWSFDNWYMKRYIVGPLTNYPDSFPLADKPDAFHKIGIGGLLGITNGVTNLTFALNMANQTNQWGQITNAAGFWTKRKNRTNPLIVAQWGPETHVFGSVWGFLFAMGGWGPDIYGGYTGTNVIGSMNIYPPIKQTEIGGTLAPSVKSEYNGDFDPYQFGLGGYTKWGASRLIDNDNAPYFIWTPGGSNSFTPLTFQVLPFWFDSVQAGGGAFVESNSLRTAFETGVIGEEQVLNSPVTLANRAWISARLKIVGTPANSNDHVQLVWTNTMTTYEGTSVWDNVFLKEQFDEHYTMMTKMFLTPVPVFWTNGTGYACTNNDSFWDEYWWWKDSLITNASAYGEITNSVPANPDMEEIDAIIGSWFRSCPVDYPKWWPNEFKIANGRCISENNIVVENSTNAPWYYLDFHFDADLREQFHSAASFNPPLPLEHGDFSSNTVWSWWADRTDTVSSVSVESNFVSSPVVYNLNEDVAHRVHFYVKSFAPYFQRVEISGWTSNATVVGTPINIGSLLTNDIAMTPTEGCGSGSDLLTEIFWEGVCDYIAPTDLVTYLVSYVPTNVWYTNSFSVTTNFLDCGTNLISVTDNGGCLPAVVGNYVPYGDGWYTNEATGWVMSPANSIVRNSAYGPDQYYAMGLSSYIPGVWADVAGAAVGSIYVSYSSVAEQTTNILTTVTYGVSNLQFSVTNEAVTNTTTICGWHAYYFTNRDEKVFADLWVTNYTVVETNHYIEGSGEVLSAVHITNVVTNATAGCGALTNNIEIYNAEEWAASNSYAVKQTPATDWPVPFVPDCIRTNEHWAGSSNLFYAPIYINDTFVLHEPCPIPEMVIGAKWGEINSQVAHYTNSVLVTNVEVRAIVEWRY